MADLSTPELVALDAYLQHTGVPYKVTSTTGDHHATNSYHYRGLACDFAAPTPTVDSPGLLAIWSAWVPLEKQLAEMIYAGAPYQIKHGIHVLPSFYGAATMGIHHNHVHVAVEKGWRWEAPVVAQSVVRVKPMFSPPLMVVAYLDAPGGGSWVLGQDGAVFAVGGAQYHGGANGQPYFQGRKAAQIEALGNGYVVIDETGSRYEYPA